MAEYAKGHAWLVGMAMDAFRLVMGLEPRNSTREEVIEYIKTLEKAARENGDE